MLALRTAFFAGVLSLMGACGGNEGDGDPAASPGSGGGGGGAGGATGSGAVGASPGSCAVDGDCLTLQAPPCWVTVCNTGDLPGPTGQCFLVPNDAGACDDGRFCTVGDACVEGACVGTPNTCGLEAAGCEALACDDDAKACSVVMAADGVDCTAEDLCIPLAQCQAGECIGEIKACPQLPDTCTTSTCNSTTGACEEVPDSNKNGQSCIGDVCQVDQVCLDGACIGGTEMDCSVQTQGCYLGVCNPTFGFCELILTPPGGACTPAEGPCHTGACDALGGCVATALDDGVACSDGDSCTVDESCSGGQCLGGVPTIGFELYFIEDFASNAAGWELDTEWQIGPALPSPTSFISDPALDHTPTGDNGLAGAVIGGDIDPLTHPYYFLTSPPIDVSAVAGPLYLEYWRFLNTDIPPWMENSVDVWDGTQWVDVWTSDAIVPLFDQAWTRHIFDITAQKNPALRVRFGHQAGMDSMYINNSGWSVDDVRLVNQGCDAGP